MIPYVATTDGITVTVRPVYLDSKSDFFERRFVFAYAVQIENRRDEEVQLLRRYWRIQDVTGKVQEVEGEGVVGKQPVLAPGDVHRYSSYCVLNELEGTMEGHYTMERARGQRFRAAVPRFDLLARAN